MEVGAAQGDDRWLREAAAEPRLVRPLARWVLKVFFRSIEVVGADRVPAEGPVVLAANHVNGLIDPALLLATSPRQPRFLAKSTLWHNVILRPFLGLAAAIPVYRRSDPGVDPARNQETFARCHAVLAAGGVIALFPEGRSHNEPALVPLKTGISRIVLEAEERYGSLGTRIVPVGLTFDDKGRFRSRVLVTFGAPIDPAAEAVRHAAAPRRSVRELTERVREAMRDVTLNYPSWREARQIERAAELYQRPSSDLPAERRLADAFAAQRAFIDGYRRLGRRAPERVAAVAASVEAYDALLAHYRLRDRQVASIYPPQGVGRFVLKSLVLLLVRLPLGAVGALLNVVPFLAVDAISRRLGRTPDVLATYKLFGSLIFYPLAWLAWGAMAWRSSGPALAVVVVAAAPVTGVIALRFVERRRFLLREARAYLMLRGARGGVAALRERRAELLESIRGLAADLEADGGDRRASDRIDPGGGD